jgi:hypothetical protein
VNRLKNLAVAIDDRLNPVVVKELRQAVRARYINILLLIFLVLMVSILGLFLINADPRPGRSDDLGYNAFFTILGFLQVATMIFVPGFVAARMAGERTGNDLGLMFATTLSPLVIIHGKLLSGMMLALLLYSIATPFMTFTYLLRGIDLPTILVLVTLSYLAVTPAVQYAVLLAALPVKRVVRSLLFLISILVAIYAVPVIGIILPQEVSGLGTRLLHGELWLVMLTIVAIILVVVMLLLAFSCAAVASPAANRALPVRLAMTGAWLLTGLICGWWALTEDAEIILIWYYVSVVIFSVAMLAGVSQRDQIGLRVRQEIPRRLVLRGPAFLLFSGSAGGLAWATLTVALTILTVVALHQSGAGSLSQYAEHLQIGIGIGLYALSYALAGLLIQRRLLARWVSLGNTWVIGLFFLALGSMLSLVIEIVAYGGVGSDPGDGFWQVLNPFALGNDMIRSIVVYLGAAVVLPLMVVSRSWFMGQVRAFRPPDRREPEERT